MKYFILVSLASLSLFSSAQITWSPPITVSNSNGVRPRIVLKSDKLPVILWGTTGGDVMLSRMMGTSFMMATKMNPNGVSAFTASWAGPDIAAKGDTIYTVYKSSPEDTGHVYLKRSFNGGQSFTGPFRADFMQTGKNRFPSITVKENGQPIVSYMGFDNSFMEAKWQVALSTDMGQTFGENIPAGGHSGGDACDCCPGSVVTKGSNVAVIYRDNLNNLRETWMGVSADGGNSFNQGYPVDNSGWMINGCPSTGPDGFIEGDSLYSTYMSASNGTGRVYFSRASLLTGQFISEPIPNSGNQNYPRIANNGMKSAICWIEQVAGNSQVTLIYTDNLSSGTWKMPMAANVMGSESYQSADVVIDGNTIHLVWETGDGKIVYRKGSISSTGLSTVESSRMKIYPNPTSELLFCELNEITTSLTLSDQQGRILKKFPELSYTGKISLNVSEIPAGIYILQAMFKDKFVNQIVTIQH